MQPVQQPTVIQAEQGGDDLLIGDLLSLDIPTGPSAPIGGGGGVGGGLGDLDLLGADLEGLGVSICCIYVQSVLGCAVMATSLLCVAGTTAAHGTDGYGRRYVRRPTSFFHWWW